MPNQNKVTKRRTARNDLDCKKPLADSGAAASRGGLERVAETIAAQSRCVLGDWLIGDFISSFVLRLRRDIADFRSR